jgi:hypothetical protein
MGKSFLDLFWRRQPTEEINKRIYTQAYISGNKPARYQIKLQSREFCGRYPNKSLMRYKTWLFQLMLIAPEIIF